jgi:hypothetical protein
MGGKYSLSKIIDDENFLSSYPNLPFQIVSGTIANQRTF